jgi:hypothetical protein
MSNTTHYDLLPRPAAMPTQPHEPHPSGTAHPSKPREIIQADYERFIKAHGLLLF